MKDPSEQIRDAMAQINERRKAGVCIECGLPPAGRIYSEAGRREWRISGCCELCFDEMFKEPEGEE